MKGLIIKDPWIDYILDGLKVWEIRGSNTSHRGHTELIKSTTGMIYGSGDLVDTVPLHGPNDFELILDSYDKHLVPLGGVPYRKPWAWVFENVLWHPEPIPYEHKQGCVIWVNL